MRRHYSRIFSGIQPTGAPHLGNYFGAIRKWVELQNTGSDCFYSIVDLHSVTLPQDPETLRYNIHLMTSCLLASGIDPDSSTLFLQSEVPHHAELSWILGCLATMARLMHLPQYKEKTSQLKEIPLGIFVYPILQSADILLYKATHVPVGEDQVQHIQLTQHLAKIFNNKYQKVFPVPQPVIDTMCCRIKGLRQPEKKMSKSDVIFKNRIEITDSPDIIVERIKKALTDFTSAVTFDPEKRPGISNLINIHSLCTGKSPDVICNENTRLDTGQYKLVVADAVVEYLKPIQEKIALYQKDPGHITEVLKKGSEKATKVAVKTVKEVKEAMGLSS